MVRYSGGMLMRIRSTDDTKYIPWKLKQGQQLLLQHRLAGGSTQRFGYVFKHTEGMHAEMHVSVPTILHTHHYLG